MRRVDHTGHDPARNPMTVRRDVLQSTADNVRCDFTPLFCRFWRWRKLLFPGLAGRESIYHNHSLFLNMKDKSLEPGCQSSILDGNPISEDLLEIEKPSASAHFYSRNS
jgi:hypothetical protein